MLVEVDAAMAIEVRVLGGDERLADDERDLVERDEVALFEEEFTDQLSVRSVDLGGDGRPVSGELMDGRQVLADLPQSQETEVRPRRRRGRE